MNNADIKAYRSRLMLNQPDQIAEETSQYSSQASFAKKENKMAKTLNKYTQKYKVHHEAQPFPSRFGDFEVKPSLIPLDLLYNKDINLLKGVQQCNIANFTPITFKMEHAELV